MFDGVQVGRIRREEQDRGPGGADEGLGCCQFMEGDIIEHHDVRGGEKGTECLFEPSVEEQGVAGTCKQEWGGQGGADPGRQE